MLRFGWCFCIVRNSLKLCFLSPQSMPWLDLQSWVLYYFVFNLLYIIDGDVYNLSDLQGEINDNPMIIKLFLIINNISILFFLLGRKFIGIFCFILTAYFFVHLIGDLDLLFHIIYSSIKLKNLWLILILVLYFLLCLINLFPLFSSVKK